MMQGEKVIGAVACLSWVLGVVFMLLAAVSKLAMFSCCGLGAKSFAVASALMLLLSIATHTCKMACFQGAGK